MVAVRGDGWLQLMPLLEEPKRQAPCVHGVHDSSGWLVTSIQEVVQVHANHLQQQLNSPELLNGMSAPWLTLE